MAVERRCWAEISAEALRHNVRVVRERIGPGVGIMAVVKANAYGHGASQIVDVLRGKVEMLGVANVEEALEVRAIWPEASVFILGPALAYERMEIVRQGFVPSVSTIDDAREFAALNRGERVRIHVVIDTGMGRTGVWQDEALAVLREIAQLPKLEIAGVATHLPSADEDEAFTAAQLERFETLLRAIRGAGIHAPLIHLLNSAGVISFPEHAATMVRAGLMLYGSSPLPSFQSQLQPVLTWKTRVTLIRDVGQGRGISYGRTFITPRAMRIGTLAVGYADGYQRHLSNKKADVLVRGRRCAVLGRVTMDQIMVDLTAVGEASVGDEAVLIGRQGTAEILAAELAEKSGTIAWEIFTGIGPRVERVNV